MWETGLTYDGRKGDVHWVQPGDVTMFVSDTWHRRMPPLEGNTGRFFLQVVYGRREIAQRIGSPTTTPSIATRRALGDLPSYPELSRA